jgi:hypothetical protein
MPMTLIWYQWLALAALGICLITLLLHIIRLVKAGKPTDYSYPAGSTAKGIRFAFTGAMSPARKESAFLHLPTYTAGLFYHMGTFLSIFLFFIFIAGINLHGWLAYAILAFLAVSASSGIGILIKRIVKKELRSLSNPDDFISNILVTIFQVMTFLLILTFPLFPSSRLPVFPSSPVIEMIYYLCFTTLALYLPVGKLRHTVYFFAARYHLGFFFGRRGVWPANDLKG